MSLSSRLGQAAKVIVFLLVCREVMIAQGNRGLLRIISPSNQAEFAPGETFIVRVAPGPGTFYSQVSLMGESPIGINEVKEAPPFEFSLTLPSNIRPGRYQITASGLREPAKIQDHAFITIDVERPDFPVKLHVEPSLIEFRFPGSQMPLGVSGMFTIGENLTLTRSSRTIFRSSDSKVASVDAIGIVTGIGPGKANISNMGISRL